MGILLAHTAPNLEQRAVLSCSYRLLNLHLWRTLTHVMHFLKYLQQPDKTITHLSSNILLLNILGPALASGQINERTLGLPPYLMLHSTQN